MHYYQFNIGDYQSHTAHLSEMEDLIYRRLLDFYYLHETPIPLDITETARKIRMQSHCECIANVLQEYFEKSPEGWIHHRANLEISKIEHRSEKASASAKARWNKERDANAMRTQCEGNATHNTEHITQDTEHKLTVSKDTVCPHSEKCEPDSEKKLPNCNHQGVIDSYHRHLPTLRKVEVWNSTRSEHLKSRWREVAADMAKTKSITAQDLIAWWDEFFIFIGTSKFLTGKTVSKDGRAFAADLEWIVKPNNFAKIIERKYHGI